VSRLALVLIVGLVVCSFGSLSASTSPTRLMEQAIKARSQGDTAGAVQTLEEAVQVAVRKEQKMLALLMLGDCQLHAEQYEQAIDTYQNLIDLQPGMEEEAEARFRQAQAYLMLGQIAKTRELCRDLKKRFPKSEFARLATHLQKSAATAAGQSAAMPEAAPAKSPVTEDDTPAAIKSEPVSGSKLAGRQKPQTSQIPRSEVEPVLEAAPVSGKPTAANTRVAALPKKPVMLTNKDLEEMNARSVGPSRRPQEDSPDADATEAESQDAVTKNETSESEMSNDPEPVAKPRSTVSEDAEPVQVAKSGKFEEVEDIASALGQVSSAQPEPVEKTPVQEPAAAPVSSRPPDSLAALLTFPRLSRQESESLATEILKDQEELQLRSGGTPDAELLIRLAGNTARFGEIKEACRLYDQLLRLHPGSRFVEEAYFEAIRLRVILRAYAAAQQWGTTFLKSFPKSARRSALQKLLDHAAQQAGRKGAKRLETGGPADPEDALSRDPHYREGTRLRQEGRYALALEHLQRLTSSHGQNPRLWHELALIEIQMRRYPQAEKHVKKLLEIDPNHSEGRSLLGYIHYQRREYQKAAGDYQKAREAKQGAKPEEGLTFFDSESAARRLHQADRRKGDEP